MTKNLATNVFKEYSSVGEFLALSFGNERKVVGGLLDYGYCPNQIAVVCDLFIGNVLAIMRKNKFKKVKS